MIKFKEMREELIDYLYALSDLGYQKECWVNGQCPAPVKYDCFDLAVHFLFDDTNLHCAPESLIGYILKDEKEAELIKNLCEVLDDIFHEYGTELSDEEYIELPKWKDVLVKAKLALNYATQQA